MALDPATLLSRTSAGDAELRTPQNGLSLGQRKLLTYLDQPRALEELAAEHALDKAKLERDLPRLAAAGLLAIDGEARGQAQSAVVLGGWRSGSSLRLGVALLALAAGAAVWYAIGTASHKAERRINEVTSASPDPVLHDGAAPAPAGSISPPTPAAAAAAVSASADAPVATSPVTAPVVALARTAEPTERSKAPAAASTPQGELARADARAPAAVPVGVAAPLPKAAEEPPAVDAVRARAEVAPSAAKSAGATAPATPLATATASATPPAGTSAPPAMGGAAPPTTSMPGAMPRTVASTPAPAPAAAPKPADAAPTNVAAAHVDAGAASAALAIVRADATTRGAPAGSPAALAPTRLAMAAPGAAAARAAPALPLTPVTRNDPEFPREAIRSGVSKGTVKARIAVDAAGKVSSVTIVDAYPPRVFDRAVREALAQWTFAAGEAGRGTEVEIAFRRD